MATKRSLGDSGTFGSQATMDAIKKQQTVAKLTGIDRARSVGGKALAKGFGKLQGTKGVPKVPAPKQTDNTGDINQGYGKGQKSLKVRPTSTGYMRK